MVKSADRTIQLLEALAGDKDGLSHAQLSSRLQIPKSSLTALVNSLVEHGYVENDRQRRRYLLGPRVVKLARSYLGRLNVVGLAQPILARIAEQTGDSCALTVRQHDHMLVVCKQDAEQPLRHSMQLGDRGPIYASASGKAVLAAQGAQAIEDYLARVRLEPITCFTHTDPEALRADLANTARDGVGHSRKELIDGIHALAVSILDADGTPVAGLSVSVPEPRDTPAHEVDVVEALFRHAALLTSKLGGQPA